MATAEPETLAATPEAAPPTPATLPSRGLLSFYDRLRNRIERAAARRGGLGQRSAEVLLLVPDVFIMLVRMALDEDVPKSTRALFGGTLAYFVLPVDLLPEAVIGPAGFADDLVLAVAVLAQAFGSELEPFAAKYWSGSQALRKVLSDVMQTAHGLLGTDLYGRLTNLLARHGIELPPPSDEAPAESA